MRRRLRQTARSTEGGFVIVAVLWILVALSTLAMIFSVYLSNSARALGATDIGVQSEALVSASLELAAYRLLSADEKARPAQGSFHFRMDDAEASVTFISEAARVDLNKASKEMLARLFEVLGAEQNAAGELADRVVGWRTKSKPNTTNEEAALYLAAGLHYSPRQAPFGHVNELSLVLGASPALVERALALCDRLQQIGRCRCFACAAGSDCGAAGDDAGSSQRFPEAAAVLAARSEGGRGRARIRRSRLPGPCRRPRPFVS